LIAAMKRPALVTDVDVLKSVLAGTTSLIAGVPAESAGARTPCPEFDARALINHLVGSMRRFQAVLTVGHTAENSAAYVAGSAPATEYAEAAAGAVDGLRAKDPDDQVMLKVGPMPCWQVHCVMLLESTVHGWDLARGTGQRLPFTEEQAAVVLEASRFVIKPDRRGPGKNFGPEVAVAPDAAAIDRLVAFTGRNPG
jgi:uncharacterized protein (TIGR03086 family)